MSLPEIMASLKLTESCKPKIELSGNDTHSSNSIEKPQHSGPRVRANSTPSIMKRRFKRKPMKYDALKHVESIHRFDFGGCNVLKVRIKRQSNLETIHECPEESIHIKIKHDLAKDPDKTSKRETTKKPARTKKKKTANFENLLDRLKELVE